MARPREEHFVGFLVGFAAGDALDLLVAGAPPGRRARYAETYLRSARSFQDPGGSWERGQYGAATQVARELLETVASSGRLEWERLGHRVGELSRRGGLATAEFGTRSAAHRLAGGTPWGEAGVDATALEMSPVTRAAILGLLFGDDDDLLARAARAQAFLTHHDPAVGTAAAIAAALTARALYDESVDVVAWLIRAARTAELSEELAAQLLAAERWLGQEACLPPTPPSSAIAAPRRADVTRAFTPLLWGLHAFLRHPDDAWEALLLALASGEGAGAMAGALAGARAGVLGIPEPILAGLHDRGQARAADLEALARRCFLLRSAAATAGAARA